MALVHVETLRDPRLYTPEQQRDAFHKAVLIGRGKLVYCLPPQRDA